MDKYIHYDGSRIKDLHEQIFGDFKAIEVIGIKDRYAQWECVCTKCGNKQVFSAKYLLRGDKKCQICNEKKAAPKKPRKESISNLDVVGMDFGFWHVKEKFKNKNGAMMCTCECKCGTVRDIRIHTLIRGASTSCGCSRKGNIEGKEFGFLKAIKPIGSSGDKGGVVWECECRCGNRINVTVSDLGWRKSCGCMGKVEEEEHTKITWAKNGGQRLRSNNTSGVRGVKRANGKWGAAIVFKKESYWLGTYDKKEDAIQARKTAEEHLYKDFAEWYDKTFAERQQKERLQERLEILTDKQREIYSLYLSGKKQSAIAKELGLSRQYISVTIKSAEKRIAEGQQPKEKQPKEQQPKEKKQRKPYTHTKPIPGRSHEDMSKYAQMDMSILSEKQKRVLQYRLAGKTNKEIAGLEDISMGAVNAVIAAIKRKAGDNKDCKIKAVKIDKNIDKIGDSYVAYTTYRSRMVYLATVKTMEGAKEIRDTAELKKKDGTFLEWKKTLPRKKPRKDVDPDGFAKKGFVTVDKNIRKKDNSIYVVYTRYNGKTIRIAELETLEEAKEIRDAAELKKKEEILNKKLNREGETFLEWKDSLLGIGKR